MLQNINFNGYTANPADYEAPDGDLAMSLNLLNEDHHIIPIPQPTPVKSFYIDYDESPQICTPLFIHTINGGQHVNYILKGPDNLLYWCDRDGTEPQLLPADINTADVSFKAVGNTLILLSKQGINYLLWQQGATARYLFLGNDMPFPLIKFYLQVKPHQYNYKSDSSSSDHSNAEFDYDYYTTMKKVDGELGTETIRRFSEAIWAAVNKYVSDVHEKNLFCHKFFVRYALRLYDNSNAKLSPPILLGADEDCDLKLRIRLQQRAEYAAMMTQPSASLLAKLLPDDLQPDLQQQLAMWHDIIKGVDVFVSAPLYDYDSSKDIGGIAGNNTIEINPPYKSVPNQIEQLSSFYHIATIPYSGPANNSDPKFQNSKFHVDNFNIQEGALSNLLTRPTLKSTVAFDHLSIIAHASYTYNSRLIIGDIQRKLYTGFHPALMASVGTLDNIHLNTIEWWVRIESLGNSYSVHVPQTHTPQIKLFHDILSPAQTSANPSTGLFLFYPHAGAKELIVKINYNTDSYMTVAIPLKPHDFLDGAYFCGGIPKLPQGTSEGTTGRCTFTEHSGWSEKTTQTQGPFSPPEYPDNYRTPNLICQSEVNNPFIFRLPSAVSVGSGTVRAFSSTTTALSQGQFGQFPIYVFCSDGIWTLENNSVGDFTSRHPVTRDVCDNINSITQLDDAVIFAANRGIMLLSGSRVTCLSENINTLNPFNILSLQSMNKIHLMMHRVNDKCFDIKPFNKFLSTCRMVYDYTNQRIILYNPNNYAYAYVLSLKSRQWGLMNLYLSHTLNSYPSALAVDPAGRVVDISIPGEYLPGLLVTRPLKLGDHDTLKTIDTTITRGTFARGHVASVLYGSRDLINWHLVWSSQDQYLRGFRGSPYKYFRLALLTNLSPKESILGATFQFSPRLTDQPR